MKHFKLLQYVLAYSIILTSSAFSSIYWCPDLAGGDDNVNFADLAAFAENWRHTGSGLAGDFNKDNKVDLKDLAYFADYWLEETECREYEGLTITQTLNSYPSAWSTYIGSNSAGSTYSWIMGPAGYLKANLVRNANNDGVAKIWIPIGNIYPAGTTAGHMQESWMQFDVKCTGGNQNSTAVWFGIFNSTGDTDNNPVLYNAGVVMCGDGNTAVGDVNTIKIYLQGGSTGYGSPSSALRVKMHLYNSSSTYTSMVTEIYTIDSAGNVSASPVWSSPERTVLHDASWPTAMDCFGIRNLNSSSSTSSTFLLDNMYFSTEGAFTGTMPKPSWVYGVSNTQTFNGTLPPSDWNAYIGAGSNDSAYFWQFGYDGGYLQTDLKLSQNNDGVAKIWKSVGNLYPAGTTAGNVQESWMQFDVKSLSGDSGRVTASVGMFNSAGDTDNAPEELYTLTTVGLLGDGTVTKIYPRMGSGNSNGGGPACRVKMHIFNSASNYSLIAFEAYSIDSAGNVSPTAFYTGSGTFLDSDDILAVTLNSFGIKNARSTSSTASSVFLFDNMYFSTEGAFTGTMPVPSWVQADYPSATIYQKWDDNTWITSIGSGSNPATAITPLKNGKHYLYTDLYRNNINSGRACIYAYLGSAAIPVGITGGNVQPFWLELDFRHISGGSFNTFFGLFNSSGDNDNNPVLNMLGVQLSGSDVQGLSKSSAGSGTSTAIAYGGSNVLHRLKAKVYNSGGQTLMNIDLYTINEETFEITKIGSVSGFVILDAGQSLPQGLNVFGIRNTPYSAGDPVVHSQFDLDNLYFSTESANIDHPVPSYADLCVSAVIQAGSSYFDPWNSTRWANWYSSGKLVKSFALDCNVTLADRGGSSSPWSPDASGLSAGQLFLLGSCARGITFNGNGQFIDLRPDTYSLDYLYDPPFYAGFPSDSSLYGLDRCFYVVHGYRTSIPETVIKNLWMKGFVQGIRSSSGQSHPLLIENCDCRFNQWGFYLMGKNITAVDSSILHSIYGGIYADKCSNVVIADNTFQDNDLKQTVLYGDIAMDSAHHNFIENNTHLAPEGGDYHCAIKFFRNKGESDSLRENGANGNIIYDNSVSHYSVAYEVGSRMGRDESYDLSDESRDYASYNLFQNNSISNSTFGIKINTSGNEVNGNTFSSVTYPILLHNVFYSLTETELNNQNGTKISYWFKNSDWTGNSDYDEWFQYQKEMNSGIDVADRYTHISYTGTPSFDNYSGSATLLKRTGSNPSQIINTSTMMDVYKSGGVPIDIAVGDFWVDSPGDEVAVIWSTPVSNVDSTDYYTIIIYDSNGMEVNHCGRSSVKWEAIAAGDFLSNKGDEIAAVHSSAVSGYYPIYIFARGRKDPLVTLYTTNTTKIAELAGGNFKTDGDSYDEVAAIYTGGSPSIIYRKPTDTGWSASTTSVWSLIDIAAGNFDNTLDGDEVAGINATSSLIYFHRPGGISSYQYAGVEGGSAWRAIAASNFIYGSTNEVAVASSVASSGVYKIYCYGQGGTTPLKEINQNVLGVAANSISAGVSPAGATLGIYERVQGFTSSDYAATMVDWRNCVVVAPSAPQTTAIPLFWLNANPSDSSQKYLKVTPIVR